jgi:hypothetical protein
MSYIGPPRIKPVGSPRESRTMPPAGGSAVSLVIPAARSAAGFASPTPPKALVSQTGL